MSLAFQFDAETHTYAVENSPFPSVTQILGAVGISDYDGIAADVLERKRILGDEVHRATHFLDEVGIADPEMRVEIRGYVLGWQKFKQESGFKVRLIEHRRMAEINGMRYGMTLDREGLIGRKPYLLDIKCTCAVEKSCGPQLAGYEMGMPRPKEASRYERAIVQLFPTGKYKVHPLHDPKDEQVFLWALGVTWWRVQNGLWRGK